MRTSGNVAPMVRRSFRMGLRVGLLIGVAFALFKTVQSRRSTNAEPPPEPWKPIVDTPRPRPPVDEAPAAPVDEVGEPLIAPVVDEPAVAADAAVAAPVGDEVAMVADEILSPERVAKPEPLDVVADADRPIAPVKKAAKAAKKAAKRVTKARKAANAAAPPPYVDPDGGICPTTHPVKAKLASRLFHLPGMFAYDRTRPDRCYVDASAAEADGFTKARR